MHSEVMSDAAPSAEREFWVIEATLWQLGGTLRELVALYGNLGVIESTLWQLGGTLWELVAFHGNLE